MLAVEEMLMMDPPACRTRGMACSVPKNAPFALTARVSSHSSSLVSSIFFWRKIPAL